MKYHVDFHPSDWIIKDMSLVPLCGDGAPFFDCKTFVEKVIFPHPNVNLLLHGAHRLYLLIFHKCSEMYVRRGEFKLSQALSEEEFEQIQIDTDSFVLGWCMMTPREDIGVTVMDFFDTVIRGHNFGELLWEKARGVCGDAILLPSHPISVDYWINHTEIDIQLDDLITRKGIHEAKRICADVLHWDQRMLDELFEKVTVMPVR